jgi:hypothetical protein
MPSNIERGIRVHQWLSDAFGFEKSLVDWHDCWIDRRVDKIDSYHIGKQFTRWRSAIVDDFDLIDVSVSDPRVRNFILCSIGDM